MNDDRDIAALRARKNQSFDGEAHLTNDELDALLDCVKHADDVRSWYNKQMGPEGPEVQYDEARERLRRAGKPSSPTPPKCECQGTGTTVGAAGFKLCAVCYPQTEIRTCAECGENDAEDGFSWCEECRQKPECAG